MAQQVATAGSATAPSPSEQTVMPSWAQASIRETFSIAPMVVRARRLPAWASGSIWLRRAVMTANSAPTKNALPSSRRQGDEQADPDAHAPGLRSVGPELAGAGW